MLLAPSAHAACVDPYSIPVERGRSAFTQTRHLNGVRAPLVSRGEVVIAAERVDWRITDPMDIVTVITPTGATQSVEGGAPQRLGPQGGDAFLSSAGLFDLLVGDFSALDTHYAITRSNVANGSWRMRLAPRAANVARFVTALEVAGCTRVESVVVRQANGDWMEIALSGAGGG